ncbi:Teichuronic acid biosynthesis protein TuaB [Polaribacter huanghezhanensis]|uniref:lipopolysaccharide biosynthesis protein n=1 Tax=Polaribacter huanghezhanensis TaxID=1354726 RepID=UPI00264808E8|nr:lipopolysaccharide biosynthesis protein [Polaribacter huanghezhanensis]WKD86098.1 Teichuronic acid biosynthesis protein TuaB [Polaribacter huanghezhanensis]
MKENSLISESIKTVVWSAIERFSVQVIQFVLTIILARLVAPSEYGLIAMLTIFIAVAQSFVDSGFSSALVQKKNRTETDFSTVFYFNIAISLISYIILYLSAPYIALYYREPLLELLCKWLGLSLIIQGFSVVQVAKLTISLDFKTQARASLTAVIISGLLGVYLAYSGYGVWALVAQSLLNNILNTSILCLLTKWIPKFIFSVSSLKSLFSFGSKLLLSGLLHTIYINLYSLVIGRKYSATDVGFFNQANLSARFPSVSLMAIISRAIYPIQCKIQDENELLLSSFKQYLRMSCYIIFPVMISMSVLAKPLILVILTDKWLPITDLFMFLCIGYMWIPLMVLNNQILHVKGRTDYFLKAEIIKKIVGLFILVVTMPFGLTVLCIGLLVYNFFDMIIIIYFSKKVINTGYFEQFKSIFSIFSLSIAMGVTIHLSLLLISNIYLQLFLGILIGLVFYLSFSYWFKIKEFNFLLLNFKKIIQ